MHLFESALVFLFCAAGLLLSGCFPGPAFTTCFCSPGRDQLQGLLHRDTYRVLIFGQRGVNPAMLDVGTVTARMERDGAAVRMLAQRFKRSSAALLLLRQEHGRPVQADRQHVLTGRDGAVGPAFAHIGTISV